MSIFKAKSNPLEVLAVNLSDRSIEAVKIGKVGESYKLLGLSRIDLDPGIVEDGKILRSDALGQAVKALFQQAKPQPWRDREIVLTLPESKVFSMAIRVPSTLKPEEIAEVIRRRAAEVVPVEPELLIADFRPTIKAEQLEFFYAATYQTLVKDYQTVFDKLGIRLRFLGLESQGLAGVAINKEVTGNVLLLDIGARTTIVIIAKQLDLRETVNIPIAGDAISNVLARDHGLSAADAETAKAEKGLLSGPDNPYFDSIKTVVDQLVNEASQIIGFWSKQSGEAIQEIVLAGGTAELPGLAEYLQSRFNLPVRLGQLPPGIELDKAQLSVAKFLPVVGLALLFFQNNSGAINFMTAKSQPVAAKPPVQPVGSPVLREPEQTKPKPTIPKWRLVTLLVLLLAAVGVFGFIWWRSTTAPTLTLPAASDTEFQDLNLSFILDVGSGVSSAENIKARVERRTLSATYALDAKYWHRIENNMRSEGKDFADIAKVYSYVTQDLIGRLWRENYPSLARIYEKSGVYLFNSYASFEIMNTSDPATSFTIGKDQDFALTVDFSALSLSNASWQALLTKGWKDKYQQDLPSQYQITATTLTPKGDGLYNVSIIVNYSLAK